MEQEVWKPIPSYEGFYEVSNLGRVRSVRRMVSGRNGKSHPTGGRILTPLHVGGKNYVAVCLSAYNKRQMEYIHRLVATTFIPNPNNKPEVNHIDGNKENNNVTNLEWVTKSENGFHAYRIGLSHKAGGTPAKEIIVTNGTWTKEFESIAAAALYFNISQSSISRSCSGEHPYFRRTLKASYK